METLVIFDKDTGRVLVFKVGENWVLPCDWDIVSFPNGVEPVLIDVNGDLYLKDNAIIVHPEEWS